MSAEPDFAEPTPADFPAGVEVHGNQGAAVARHLMQFNFFQHDSSANAKKLEKMSGDDHVTQLLESQQTNIGLLEDLGALKELRARHEAEIAQLQEQLARVSGLLQPLIGLVLSLRVNREQTMVRRTELNMRLEGVVNSDEQLKAEFESLNLHLDDLERQQQCAQQALDDARLGRSRAESVLFALIARWMVWFPGQEEPEVPAYTQATAWSAQLGRGDDEGDVLAYGQRLLNEAHTILSEALKVLTSLQDGIYRVGPLESEAEFVRLSEALAERNRELATTQRKLREVQKRTARDAAGLVKPTVARKPTSASPRRDGTNGLVPGIGLFLMGVVLRELVRSSSLPESRQTVFMLAALTFGGFACWSLMKWKRSADGTARATVAVLGVLCVVAGNFSWLVALVLVLAALWSVVTTKKIGAGLVAAVLLCVVGGVAVPGLMWWSWGGFDWIADLF